MYKRLWDIILVFVWTWGVSKNWLKINSITEAVKFLVITAWVLHHYKGILFILANRYWVKDPAKRLGLPFIKDWIKKYIFLSPFIVQFSAWEALQGLNKKPRLCHAAERLKHLEKLYINSFFHFIKSAASTSTWALPLVWGGVKACLYGLGQTFLQSYSGH